jgi:hypothetical protein
MNDSNIVIQKYSNIFLRNVQRNKLKKIIAQNLILSMTCNQCTYSFDSAPGCGSFKPLCRDPDFGSSIQEQCSLTCGACSLKPVVAPSSIISNNSTISVCASVLSLNNSGKHIQVKKTGKELVVIVRQPSNIELECKDIAKTCEDNKYLCDNPVTIAIFNICIYNHSTLNYI